MDNKSKYFTKRKKRHLADIETKVDLIGTQKEVVWEGTLDKGVYVLIPSTTGCLFRKRQNQPTSDIHLTCMENGEIQLSHEYHQAIIEIFHQLDLDESGSLSKAEFNLYNWRTSGMEMKVNKT